MITIQYNTILYSTRSILYNKKDTTRSLAVVEIADRTACVRLQS